MEVKIKRWLTLVFLLLLFVFINNKAEGAEEPIVKFEFSPSEINKGEATQLLVELNPKLITEDDPATGKEKNVEIKYKCENPGGAWGHNDWVSDPPRFIKKPFNIHSPGTITCHINVDPDFGTGVIRNTGEATVTIVDPDAPEGNFINPVMTTWTPKKVEITEDEDPDDPEFEWGLYPYVMNNVASVSFTCKDNPSIVITDEDKESDNSKGTARAVVGSKSAGTVSCQLFIKGKDGSIQRKSYHLIVTNKNTTVDPYTGLEIGIKPTHSGQEYGYEFKNPITSSDLEMFAWGIVESLRSAATLLAVLSIVVGGLVYISSFGNPTRMQSAKGFVTYALIGFVVVSAAPTLVEEVKTITSAESNFDTSPLKTVPQIIMDVLKFVLTSFGLLATIGFAIAGAMYVWAFGNSQRQAKAKTFVFYCVIAVAVSGSALIVLAQLRLILGAGSS